MQPECLDIIVRFWGDLLDEELEVFSYSHEILQLLGHDGFNLSVADIANALISLPSFDNWRNVGWACKEELSGMIVTEWIPKKDFLLCIGCACLLAESIRREHFDWSGSVDDIIELLYHNRDKCHSTLRAELLTFLFRR